MTCKTQPASLHQRLKASTAAWHSRLDRTPALRQLIQPELALEQYVAALRGLVRAHGEVERWLSQLTAAEPDAKPKQLPAYRPRVPALAADLARLEPHLAPSSSDLSGTAPSGHSSLMSVTLPAVLGQTGQQSLPSASEVHPDCSPEQAREPIREQAQAHYLGIRYVLEGATQGGKMISAQVATQLPQLRSLDAFAYWSLLEAANADWIALSQLLARPAHNEDELTAISAGARAAYCCFIDRFLPTGSATGSAIGPATDEDCAQLHPSSPLRQS